MNFDIQKASMLKRISAWMLDVILLVVLASGFGLALSAILDYDRYSEEHFSYFEQYEHAYGVSFETSQEDLDKMTEEEKARYEEATQALLKDEGYLQAYSMLVSLSMVIISISILMAYLCLELLVPLLLKNGQTIGKKVFAIGLMRADGIRLTPFMLFVRTVLGKYTIETMIPVMAVSMLMLGTMGGVALAALLVIFVAEIVLMIRSNTNATIHDYMSATVVVDLPSQMIFDSPEALLEYRRREHEKKVRKQSY